MRIEATTSSVASVLPIQARGGIEEATASRPTAVDGDRKVFVNPKLLFDDSALALIVQIRDLETGDVTRQFPSREVVERYRRQVQSGERGAVPQTEAGSTEIPDRVSKTDGVVTLPGRETGEAPDGPTEPEVRGADAPAVPAARAKTDAPTPAPAETSSPSRGDAARTQELSTVV